MTQSPAFRPYMPLPADLTLLFEEYPHVEWRIIQIRAKGEDKNHEAVFNYPNFLVFLLSRTLRVDMRDVPPILLRGLYLEYVSGSVYDSPELPGEAVQVHYIPQHVPQWIHDYLEYIEEEGAPLPFTSERVMEQFKDFLSRR